MNGWQYFTFDRLPVSPWRNGGGETREIVSLPAGKQDFDWRASIATIAQDGPFSVFPGIDRSITLLSGGGVHLVADSGAEHALNVTGEPYAFSGDTALSARLTDGLTTDFNIMTRRAVCSSRVRVAHDDLRVCAEKGGVIYALSGNWTLPDGTRFGAGEGFCWSEPDSEIPVATKVSKAPAAGQEHSLLLWASIIRD